MIGPVSLKRILGIYSLKNFIIDDVIGYYDISSINREIIAFQSYHNYPIEIFYLFCFSSCVFLYFLKSSKKELKIRKLNDYKNTSRYVKVFTIIFTMIFTKDIENAI